MSLDINIHHITKVAFSEPFKLSHADRWTCDMYIEHDGGTLEIGLFADELEQLMPVMVEDE